MLPAYVRRFFLRYNPCINNISFFFASLLLSSKQHYLLGRRVKKLYLPLALPDLCPIGKPKSGVLWNCNVFNVT